MDRSRGETSRPGRLRAIAAVLEKVAIFVAMALLTYALIVVARVSTSNVLPDKQVMQDRHGIPSLSWVDSA